MQNICVFGSSSEKIDKAYLDAATHLGSSLAKRGCTVVFGAGKYGVMGAVARGVIAENGALVGVSPEFFLNTGVLLMNYGELITMPTMRERKAVMEDKADAFIICPGGIGTYEEFFEVITLKQLGRHQKPIIIYNLNGYYDPMISMMETGVEQSFMSDAVHRLYSIAATEQQVFEQLDNYVAFGYNKYD